MVFSRSQISVACLLSERVLRSMHNISVWVGYMCCLLVGVRVGVVLGVVSVLIEDIGVVSKVVQVKRQEDQAKASSVLCVAARQQQVPWYPGFRG